MIEAATFSCSICCDVSTEICVYCTKDACGNHLCERCHRCSDCCHCDVPLTKATKEARYFSSHPVDPHPLQPVHSDAPAVDVIPDLPVE